MAAETREVRALCTANEYALFGDSVRGRLERLSIRDLRSRVRRARNLRDKYRGSHRRRRSGGRGKLPQDRATALPELSGTRQKADLFGDALERFERRLGTLEEKELRRQEETKRREAAARRLADRQRRRIEAERADRESHLARPKGDAGPRQGYGAPPPQPGRMAQYAFGKGSSGHFRSANRRFQARHDRPR